MGLTDVFKARLDSIKRSGPEKGPFFITEYPEGFQGRRAQASLEGASAKVDEIYGLIRSSSPPADQIASGNHSNFASALVSIKSIKDSVMIFKMEMRESLGRGEPAGAPDQREALDTFMENIKAVKLDISIDDPLSCEAAKALADVLQITRKSIPDVFGDTKTEINEMRDGLVDKIKAYDPDLSRLRRDSEASTDPESDISSGPPSPTNF
ncbi:MAG: hypothetical protein K0U37_00605 [Gammaproteobacteria bacterium]|nr:hypothetical protein [Gammaproteobacteria bacterium]